MSIASSCNTYISEGGDAYKCARDEFFFRGNNDTELIDFSDTTSNNLRVSTFASDQRLHSR